MKALIMLRARLKANLLTKAYLRDLYDRDRLWVLPIAAAGILSAAGFFIFTLFMNYRGLLSMGINAGEPEIVFLFSGILSGLIIFFIGTPLCLSNIFYAGDNILVAALPVSTSAIIFSRLMSVYLFLLPLHLAVTIPAAAVYLPAAGSPASWFALILTCLTAPAFPLLLALAAASLLAGFGRLSGRRTFFEMAGMLAALGLAAALQLIVSRTMISGGDFSAVTVLLTKYTGILERVFFVSAWSAAGFRSGGALYSVAALIFSATATAAAAAVLKYVKIDLSSTNEKLPARRRKKNGGGSHIPLSGRSISMTLLKREWMVVKSNSAFLIEIAGEVIILPILLVIFYFASPVDLSTIISEVTETLTFLPIAVLGMLILISSINSISSTTLSREGKSFAISKNIPLSGSIQVKAKMHFHVLLFVSSWYLNLIILMLILKLSPVHLLYLVPAGPAVILLDFIAAIHVDLARPVLHWTHPQQAMKQNMNVLTGMGFGILVLAFTVLPAAGLFLLGLGPVPAGLSSVAAAGLADIILFPRLLKYSERRYREINI